MGNASVEIGALLLFIQGAGLYGFGYFYGLALIFGLRRHERLIGRDGIS